jgi:hypothetical protein
MENLPGTRCLSKANVLYSVFSLPICPEVVKPGLRTAAVPVLPAVEVMGTEVRAEPEQNTKETSHLMSRWTNSPMISTMKKIEKNESGNFLPTVF